MRKRTRTIVPDDLLAPAANGNGRKTDTARDDQGRFKLGNRAAEGHGRPIDGLRGAVARSVSDDDLAAIIKRAVAEAKRGSARAREWLFDRVYGRARVADAAPLVLDGLPRIVDPKSAFEALAVVVEQAASGKLNPSEAARLAAMISETRRLLDVVDPSEWDTDVDPTGIDFSYL